jgi:tyrosyl-tRNA synthetase
MGKTAQGAVWLNRDRLSDFDYWQYWRNADDADVGRFLRLFTDLPLAEVARLETLEGAERNEAKKILANEATTLCRGAAAAAAAAEAARGLFERRDAAGLDAVPFDPAAATAVPRAELANGLGIVELFRRTGLVPSNSEARRLIRAGGARLNEERIDDETLQVGIDQLVDDRLLLSAGRKRHAWVRAV